MFTYLSTPIFRFCTRLFRVPGAMRRGNFFDLMCGRGVGRFACRPPSGISRSAKRDSVLQNERLPFSSQKKIAFFVRKKTRFLSKKKRVFCPKKRANFVSENLYLFCLLVYLSLLNCPKIYLCLLICPKIYLFLGSGAEFFGTNK